MEITTKSKQSINLIPESERENPLLNRIFPFIVFLLIILVEIVIYGVVFILNINSEKNLADTKAAVTTATESWQKYEPIASSVKAILAKKTSFDQGVIKYSGFDTKLDNLRQDIPLGIAYSTMSVSLDGKATVSGKSSDPKIIYQYYNGLLNKKNYTNVNLSNVSKDNGLIYNFTMNFTIADAK